MRVSGSFIKRQYTSKEGLRKVGEGVGTGWEGLGGLETTFMTGNQVESAIEKGFQSTLRGLRRV